MALLLLLTSTAWSAPRKQSDADMVWQSVVEAYQKITSFRVVTRVNLQRGALQAEQQTTTVFARPTLVWWHARGDTAEGRVEMYIICDGEKIYRCRNKQTRAGAAPTTLTALAAYGFGNDNILLMLLDGNATAVLKQFKVDRVHSHGRMEKEDKSVCEVIGLGDRHRDQETRLWIDPNTRLISRVETKMRSKGQDYLVTTDLEYSNMGSRFERSQFKLPPGYDTEKAP